MNFDKNLPYSQIGTKKGKPMLPKKLQTLLSQKLQEKRTDGTYKAERIIQGPQGPEISLADASKPVLNFCANNYLGLSNHPAIKEAAQKTLETHGFGMSSVRFICGTQDIHKELEQAVSAFLGTEDTILYTSCFDANGGLFENLLGAEDVIISASLNHASIIDGVRLCKAQRKVFQYDKLNELEECLLGSQTDGLKVVVTDGVFSMEGLLAPLDRIAPLCRKYGAILVVDDSHATGFMGENGRGTAEHCGVQEEVDLFTSTFGKALGGASGGYISGKKECVEWFRNCSRPYLFSNSLAPSLVGGALKALEIIRGEEGDTLRARLHENTRYFREKMMACGFRINESPHPIVPIMLGEATVAAGMAEDLLKEGIYVIGFSYPVVPKGAARIRVQISAAHTREQLDLAITAFERLGKRYGVVEWWSDGVME